jgi:hypothetical protein
MTRGQRRAHLWIWAALAILLVLGMTAGLLARPANIPAPGAER